MDEVSAYIVLYGGRQNGKTSLLSRLEVTLRSRVAVCRIDFQLIKGASAESTFAFLAAKIAQALPLAPNSGQVRDGPTLLDFLNQALDRADIRRFVLILDEWGALPAATREILANTLRSFFQSRFDRVSLAKLQIIFSGGVELYTLIITEASSLHNICEEVYLADLPEAEAVSLIVDGLSGLGLTTESATLIGTAVFAQVAGHPYFTQKIGSLLERYHKGGATLSPPSVERTIEQIQAGDSLLRRIRDDLHEQHLEDAVRRLLTSPPRFTRLDDDMARLELIGLAKPGGTHWGPRNHLLAAVFSVMLGLPELPVAPPAITPITPAVVAPPVKPSSPVTKPASVERLAAALTAQTTTPAAPRSATPAAKKTALADWVPELVHVPAGPFLMGSSDADTQAHVDEKPQHRLVLPDYWIGKTPVTNAQFRPFVAGDGYRNEAYWTQNGWQWREAENVAKPGYWEDSKWNGEQHPVVGISWFEAVAYCRWLSARTGDDYRLPSEAEWEKAARGPQGLLWPWGNTWEDNRCNSAKGSLSVIGRLFSGRTTPVGQYPTGASPYGALDMAGNVYEWCATRSGGQYPYQVADEWQEDYLETEAGRRIRGGGFTSSLTSVRGAYRSHDVNPRYRYFIVGLRVASHSLRTDPVS